MTQPYPFLASLTYDGTNLLDLATNGWEFSIGSGLWEPAEVRGVDVTIPYADGQVARPRRFHQRKIILPGIVQGRGDTETEMQEDYRALLRVLSVLFASDRVPADLVAGLEDGYTKTVAARPLNVVDNQEVPSERSSINVELLAVVDWTTEGPGS